MSDYTWDDEQHRWVPGQHRNGDEERCRAYYAELHRQEEARLHQTGWERAEAPPIVLLALERGEDLSGVRRPPLNPRHVERAQKGQATKRRKALAREREGLDSRR